MDPLHPITPGAVAPPSRRVPPVDRLRRLSREGDRPERDPGRGREEREAHEDPLDEDPGEGHVDIRI